MGGPPSDPGRANSTTTVVSVKLPNGSVNRTTMGVTGGRSNDCEITPSSATVAGSPLIVPTARGSSVATLITIGSTGGTGPVGSRTSADGGVASTLKTRCRLTVGA